MLSSDSIHYVEIERLFSFSAGHFYHTPKLCVKGNMSRYLQMQRFQNCMQESLQLPQVSTGVQLGRGCGGLTPLRRFAHPELDLGLPDGLRLVT